jgi:hypothetical protein
MYPYKVKFYQNGCPVEKEFENYNDAFRFVQKYFWEGKGAYFIIIVETPDVYKINYTSEDCIDIWYDLMEGEEIEYIGEQL